MLCLSCLLGARICCSLFCKGRRRRWWSRDLLLRLLLLLLHVKLLVQGKVSMILIPLVLLLLLSPAWCLWWKLGWGIW